ncbi:MAG: antibiotic biosynthesis monooxygenase [Chroococcidiopsidaceae cyanobacterium CP_BM_RX_35]|nr:antibiotic biosynthesis monooxygenase [Chroococcidiopsidaceae cyanobacterium CP_BM_RX_35]
MPEDQEAEFLKNWRQTTEVYSHTPGLIETHLHRNKGIGDGTFKFINIAYWESVEAWRSTHGDYHAGEDSLPGVKGHPAIYESVINVQLQGEK